jgi:hypothetical protein
MPENELHIALQNVYDTFARNQRNPKMEGCPCCVGEADRSQLHRKHLRELTGDDIGRYTFKAMTTWGGIDDFRHYLPRILELHIEGSLWVDHFIVVGKLEYGEWKSWPEDEQEAIRALFLAWWMKMRAGNQAFDAYDFVWIHRVVGNVELMLREWYMDLEGREFRVFVDMVHDWYCALRAGEQPFVDMGRGGMTGTMDWMRERAGYLEKGFFHFEEKDPEFAARISQALFVLENC